MPGDEHFFCRVEVQPENRREREFACSFYQKAVQVVNTTALMEYENGVLLFEGRGRDGRCALCRYFCRGLKNIGVRFRVHCPFDPWDSPYNWKVNLGGLILEQQLLEDNDTQEKYFKALEENPEDLEAATYLGLHHEFKGSYPGALQYYLIALRMNKNDDFLRNRVTEILKLILTLVQSDF